MRKHIRSCFDSVTCYLLPHPGLKVATNPYFDGRLSGTNIIHYRIHIVCFLDIDSEFKKYLSEFVPLLLDKSNLIQKKINGNIVTGRGLFECFKVIYVK